MKPQPKEILKKNIIEQLTWNDKVDATNVNVDVKDNTILLKGTVNSYLSKLVVAREAMLIARNYDIDNQLNVEFKLEEQVPTDNEITDNIQNSLIWNSNINPVNIRVETENGKVTLSGTVSRSWEKTKAEELVTSTKGVVDIFNNISVKPASIRSDNQIEKDIRKTFERSQLIEGDNVYIEVKKGVVHLSGSVAMEPIKNEIHDIALNTKGVADVIDEITIA